MQKCRHIAFASKWRKDKKKREATGRRNIAKRWDSLPERNEPRPLTDELPDPLYLLAFEDFTTGRKHIWTIHAIGDKKCSFRIFENGQEIPISAFTQVVRRIEKKRIPIGDFYR